MNTFTSRSFSRLLPFLFPLLLYAGAELVLSQAQASELTSSAAINKSGRQRMLAQRIAKAYSQIALGAITKKSRTILESSSTLFEQQLDELKRYPSKPDVQEALANEEKIWGQIKPIIAEQPTRDGSLRLMQLSDSLLQSADQATRLLEQNSGNRSAHLVNLAGRQRMLSQRMSRNYMLSKEGIKPEEIAKEIAEDQRAFETAMRELESSPLNTRQINNVLENARGQWKNFLVALDNQQTTNLDSGLIVVAALASEHLLEIMDTLTGLYEVETTGK